MAGFRMHISTSTVLGIGYGGAAFSLYGVPAPTATLAGGLCAVSGMLPDLDSGPGVPLRESVAFAAAVVPMLLVNRMEAMQWSSESMVLAGAGVYLAIRFGLSRLLKWYTVHRGMFHSLPAAAIAGELGYLLASGDTPMRLFKAGGVVIGFMSHLILDEIYSVELKYGVPTVKKSFGTAIKLFDDKLWPNISCWGKLIALTWLIFNDPTAVRDFATRAIEGRGRAMPAAEQGGYAEDSPYEEDQPFVESNRNDNRSGFEPLRRYDPPTRYGWSKDPDKPSQPQRDSLR
ncbi:MAG: metal-dependent hydrolase [Pirellulales bacterium]